MNALGHALQEAASEPTGQTHRQPGTSVPGEASAGSQTGLSRELGAQRTVLKASKGNKAHGSIGCELAGNGDSHYGLVGGVKPWSRSALDTNRAGLDLVSGRDRVLAAGPNATGAHLLGCGSVERHRCSEGAKPGNRRRRWVQTRSGVLQHAGQPSRLGVGCCRELALWTAQPLEPIGRATGWGVRGTAERSRGNPAERSRALAAPPRWWRGSTPSSPISDVAAVGLGRQRHRQDWRPSLGTRRTRSNARLAGNGRWERANSIGSGNAQPRPPVWQKARCSLACTPGTRRRMWTLWTKHGSRSLASLAVYRGGSGQAFGSATEQASAGSPVPADAASAGFASVGRRHEPSLEVCASARSDGAGDDNGKRATTAVMRHGYRRGECFEGYEPRCGERCRAARPVGARTFGFSKQTARGRHRETQRTLSGSGCKMSEPPERSKPSRW